MDSAWISSRMRSPRAAYTSWCWRTRDRPAKLGLTITASKCAPSPLTFLAGAFYSVHTLPPFWQAVSRLNPFFYAIDGFRYGFFGQSDVPPWTSLAIATATFAALSWATLLLLRSGYKLRH